MYDPFDDFLGKALKLFQVMGEVPKWRLLIALICLGESFSKALNEFKNIKVGEKTNDPT